MMVTAREAADALGASLRSVQEVFDTRLVPRRNGKVPLIELVDVLREQQAAKPRVPIDTEVAMIKRDVVEMTQKVNRLLEIAGVYSCTQPVMDHELAELAHIGLKGVEAFRPYTTPRVLWLADIAAALSDRDLGRMDRAAGRPRAWADLLILLQDLKELLVHRYEVTHSVDVQNSYLALDESIVRMTAVAKFYLALTNRFSDPSALLDRICIQAGQLVKARARASFSIAEGLGELRATQGLADEGWTGKCPDGG